MSGVLLLYTLYFVLFALAGLPRKDMAYPSAGRALHFAVLVPARNEESYIGALLESIRNADYPAEKLDVIVIPDRCTDNTEGVARRFGAEILPCPPEIRAEDGGTMSVETKGGVLTFAFSALRARPGIDAFIVLDADNCVHPSFFREMNNALVSGARIAQCRRTGKNTADSWVAGCYEVYYSMQNVFFNHARASLGFPAAVNGTGWAVTKDVLSRTGFAPETITEDFEFTILSALSGETIAYCPAAVTCDTFTTGLAASMTQRVRWTCGILTCIKKYEGRLLAAALRGSRACLDAALVNIMAPVIAATFVTTVTDYLFFHASVPFFLYMAVSAAVSWTVSSLSALIAVWKNEGGVRRSMKGILLFPVFIATWFPVLILCLFKKDCSWDPVRRTRT